MTNNEVTNLSLILSGAIAIAAIVSPIIVSLLDNLFLKSKYKNDVIDKQRYEEQQHIGKIYEEYLISLATISSYSSVEFYTAEHKERYKKSLYLLLNFVDDSSKKLMLELDNLIEGDDWIFINSLVIKLIPIINSKLLRYKN